MSELDFAYRMKMRRILTNGEQVSPRGMKTRELTGEQLRLSDSSQNILTIPERKLNYAFCAAEWLWMLFGRDDVAFVSAFNKNIANFSDDGESFYGAYGPRIAAQLEYVYNCLKGDPDTRQAVMMTWRPCPPKTKDVPCTLVFQFLIRNGALDLLVTMRSNDIWLGTPYDTFNFTQIQNFMAGLLGIPRGRYTLTAGSFHIYEQHWECGRSLSDGVGGLDVRTADIVFAEPGFHNYLAQSANFNGIAEALANGKENSSFINSAFPRGISEHVLLLNDYAKKDGSHRNNPFWGPVYAQMK